MTLISTISLGSRQVEIYSMSGEVMHAQKWSTTEVSGGGGGVISQGSGYVQNRPITSKTTTHDQVIIRAADGSEESLQVEDMHLAIRPGHWASFIWAIPQGRKTGPYVALYIHNTDAIDFIKSGVNKACFPMWSSLVGLAAFILGFIGIIVCFASSVVTGALMMAPFASYFLWLIRRRNAFTEQVTALCQEIRFKQAAPKASAA